MRGNLADLTDPRASARNHIMVSRKDASGSHRRERRMWTFILGGAGAVAPELLRLYDARLQPLQVPKHYWVVSFAYVLLGGLVAYLLAAPHNNYSAFYLGVSLPVTVGAMARGASRGGSHGTLGQRDDDSLVEEVEPVDATNVQMPLRHFLTLV
jgi:hypothetical protein